MILGQYKKNQRENQSENNELYIFILIKEDKININYKMGLNDTTSRILSSDL